MKQIQQNPLSPNHPFCIQPQTVTPSQQRAQTQTKHKQWCPLLTKYLQRTHLSLSPHLFLRSPLWKRPKSSTSPPSGRDQHAGTFFSTACRPLTMAADSRRALPSRCRRLQNRQGKQNPQFSPLNVTPPQRRSHLRRKPERTMLRPWHKFTRLLTRERHTQVCCTPRTLKTREAAERELLQPIRN